MASLDRTDRRILAALSREPRTTVVALAQELGLSRNTVQARMTALEHKKAFSSFGQRINPGSLGYPFTAFISIHVQQQRLQDITVELSRIPEILEAYGLAGHADLLARVVSRDAEDLFRINGKILACPGVERTDTSLAMHELIPFRIEPLLDSSDPERN